jgi:predicted transcriptional regulator
MTTTTVRLPEDLKARLDKLAASDGKSTHAFMVEALARTADRLERQRAFDAEVQERWQRFQRTGEYHTTDDLRAYALAKARGEEVKPPKPRRMTVPAHLKDPSRP